jgi:hypothetical protein
MLEFKAVGNKPAIGLGVPLPSPSFDASGSEARSVGDGSVGRVGQALLLCPFVGS